MIYLLSSIRNAPDKHKISISLKFMWPSVRDNLGDLWAAGSFRFQWKSLRAELLRDPVLDYISPNFNKRTFLMYKQWKTIDNSKKLHNF